MVLILFDGSIWDRQEEDDQTMIKTTLIYTRWAQGHSSSSFSPPTPDPVYVAPLLTKHVMPVWDFFKPWAPAYVSEICTLVNKYGYQRFSLRSSTFGICFAQDFARNRWICAHSQAFSHILQKKWKHHYFLDGQELLLQGNYHAVKSSRVKTMTFLL